jgi:hypothetical protein
MKSQHYAVWLIAFVASALVRENAGLGWGTITFVVIMLVWAVIVGTEEKKKEREEEKA